MQRTFLVTVELTQTDEGTLAGIAEDIMESCQTDGVPVISVRPWSSPSAESLFGSDTTEGLAPSPLTQIVPQQPVQPLF